MSVQAMDLVLEHPSASPPMDRFVLLVLANFAQADGSGAYPSNRTLRACTGLSERACRGALRRLETAGHIERTGTSAKRTTIYRIAPVEDGAQPAGGAPDAPSDPAPRAPSKGAGDAAPGTTCPLDPAPRAPNPSFNPVGSGRRFAPPTAGAGAPAREARPEQPDPTTPKPLVEAARTVQSILGQVPGLHVEPVGIENALAAYPKADHELAAHETVCWVTGSQVHSRNAARLLQGVLRRQATAPPAPVAAGGGSRGPRPSFANAGDLSRFDVVGTAADGSLQYRDTGGG